MFEDCQTGDGNFGGRGVVRTSEPKRRQEKSDNVYICNFEYQHFDIQTAPIKCFHHFFLASRNNSRQPYRQTTHAQTESSVHFILAVHINYVQTAIGLNIFFIIISLWDMCQANARTGVAKTRHTYPPTARNEGMSSKLIGTTAYVRS